MEQERQEAACVGSGASLAGPGTEPEHHHSHTTMRARHRNLPPGIEALHACNGGRKYSYNWYKGSVSRILEL